MKTYTKNDLLDLHLKYKNYHDVIGIIQFIEDTLEREEWEVNRVSELESELDDVTYDRDSKDEKIKKLETQIEELEEKIEQLEKQGG